MIGQSILHYKIESKLGEGGMGEVFLAYDTKLDRQVALKFLPDPMQKDPEARERLVREAKAASKLHHPNILTIHAVEQHDGRDFIVMEFVEGKPLTESSSETHRSLPNILDLAIAVAGGLQKAHAAGVIHRDIKPANILIDVDGHPRILDFGLAKVRGADKLTKTGSTLGTVAYMSPEQSTGQDVDARSDIFSFGVLLYELITGRTPFHGAHEAAITYAIINETPEPMSRFKAGVPHELERIVAKSLAKSVDERYQSIADMAADLRRLRSEMEASRISVQRPASSVAKAKWGYLKYIVASSVVFLAVLAILIFKPFKFEVAQDQKASASENSLAVMYFDNLVDAEDKDKTAEMAANLLITGLSESRFLRVVSRQRLFDILSSLGKGDSKKIDQTTASAVALRANVKFLVTGKVFQTSPGIILSAEVSDAGTGDIVSTERVNGDEGESLFAIVDRLSASLRNHLSLPEAAKNEATRSVADVTTHSPEAYRYYLEGNDYSDKNYTNDARQSYEKALRYDSTFAMTYFRLANLSNGEEEKHFIEQAVKYADNASWKEQHYIREAVAQRAGKLDAALEEYRQIAARYPDETEPLVAMGDLLFNVMKEPRQAIEYYHRALALDSKQKWAYNQLAYAYNELGNFDKSIWAINQYIALAPDEANPYDSRGDLYALNGHLDEAIASYRSALQIKPEFESQEKLGYMYLYKGDYPVAESTFQSMAGSAGRGTRSQGRYLLRVIPAYQGRFSRALDILDEGINADQMEHYNAWWSTAKHMAKIGLYRAQGHLSAALAEFDTVQALYRKAFPEEPVQLRYMLVDLLSANKDFVRAQQVAESLRRDIEKGDSSQLSPYWYARGCLAYGEGAMDEAIEDLNRIPTSNMKFSARYLLGSAYLRKGTLDRAVHTLETALTRYDDSRAQDPGKNVLAHYLLGQAYEQSGWRDKAAEQYKTFLDIWKDADPGIPEIDDAKARLANLRS